jgi:hypothetical protein
LHDLFVQAEPLIYREEVTAMLFLLADINANVQKIIDLLEDDFGGEVQEEDA